MSDENKPAPGGSNEPPRRVPSPRLPADGQGTGQPARKLPVPPPTAPSQGAAKSPVPQGQRKPAPPAGSRPTPSSKPSAVPTGRQPSPSTAASRSVRRKSTDVPDPRLASLRIDEDEEISPVELVVSSVRDSLPAFLVSLTVHLVLLIALFLITLQPFGNTVLDLTMGFSEATPEVAEEESVGVDLEEPTPPPPNETTETPTETPMEVTPPMETTAEETEVEPEDAAPTASVREALTGREGVSRGALLEEFGGTSGTEDAVNAGLDWLVRNQSRDGTWSLKGPFSDGTQLENRSAATAMALLCFLGAGHTHVSGDHQKTVARGLDALLKRQGSNGDFYRIDGTQSEIPNHHLYTHAQGLIVVCEAAAMTGEARFMEAAQKAIAFAEESQAPEGGWRYVPKQESDLSVTGWFVIGLQSARMAGLEVKESTWEGISRFLARCHHEDGVRFIYKKGYEPTLAMTAEGLLCRQYVGWGRDEPALQDGVAYLSAHPVNWNEKDFYYWYYAAQVMHNMEGEAWQSWNSVMREVIPANQQRSGRDRGSWDPEGDRWAMTGGGRLYSTCLMLLTLEVYYRHLPLYRYRIQ